ncbi:MAG: helicase-exonuclease AddAB subunit AddA [Clostridia bacterium]|nr:helicase-exonuclease AddAB subunit AddA [Clostridia bacterium]
MAFEPTKPQSNAIDASPGTLVSAAAGSGKTAVLVERVIRKLCGENPIDANRLLVVTFTDAAAKEMRIRIEKRLNDECRKFPDNHFLVKQKLQLRNAKICTIDSFCIELVRENFDRLGINPDFAIGDEGQFVLLSENALNEVLNNNFEAASEEFKLLTEAVSNDFDEGNLRKYIKDIYNYSQNMPFPDEWIYEQLEKCFNDSNIYDSFEKTFLIAEERIGNAIKNIRLAISGLEKLSELSAVYEPNFAAIISDLEILLKNCKKRDFNTVGLLVSTFKLPKLPSVRGANDIPEVVSAKNLRDEAKDLVLSLNKFFYADYDKVFSHSKTVELLTATLLKLTLEYSELYNQKRQEKNIMTFSDTEHLALSLLCEYKDGKVVLKDIAEEIINRFDEVLVDEFQDTNNMQDMLFSILSNNEKRLFVVGDLKQSIYRFRGANPKNFSDKKDRYVNFDDAADGQLKKIVLGNNFRSRKGICDFTNFFFDIMMNGEKSILKYDESDHLIYSAKFPENNQTDVEISFVDPSGVDVTETDVKNIAEFIHRFMRDGVVTDKESKELRKPRFSDFTLLFRSLATKGAEYAMELEKYGIPVSYNLDGYVKTTEIQIMFSLLKTIENPTRDVELAATLMSPVFMFSADDLAEIRLTKRNGSLISAVIAKANDGNKKCSEFLSTLNKFSNFAATSSVSELISHIYDQTGILNVVSVLESGEGRRSNLLMLNSLAASYDENSTGNNISRFIEHIEKLSEKNIRGAGVSAGDDSITLMTIHKSKGLQFPVCIIADAAAPFSHADTSERLLIDENLGVSFKYEIENGEGDISPLLREVISDNISKEQLAEALRLFYVAVTRAEEKLFISVVTKDVVQKFENYAAPLTVSKSVEDYADKISYGSSYGSWLISALLLHKASFPIRTERGISGVSHNLSGEIDLKISDWTRLDVGYVFDDVITDEVEPNKELAQKISDAISYKYPYNSLKNIESKASVTEVAHKAEKTDYSFSSTPAFMSKMGLTSAQIGTATHRFMQFADFARAETDILSEVERLYEWQFITLKEKEAINIDAIRKFFESDIYSRLKKANIVEREMRFLTEISAGELNFDLSDELANEKIVVQGSVDCVFVEDDGIVVVDFKTDRIKNEQDLSLAYGEQLNIYAKACQKIFELPIKQKIIYSFALNKEIEL